MPSMVHAAASSSAPPIAWVIVIAILVISFIMSIVKGIGSAGTTLAALKTLKSVVGDGQLLAGRPTTGSLRLSGPVTSSGRIWPPACSPIRSWSRFRR